MNALKTFSQSQQMNGQPYIGEYLDESTGQWLRDDKERGRFYNHSTFADLIITGLVGLHPQDNNQLLIRPLIPTTGPNAWDFFTLDNILYHNHTLSILWDRTGQKFHKGIGLMIFCDSKIIAQSPKLQPISATLP